jgi:hypothetical protein
VASTQALLDRAIPKEHRKVLDLYNARAERTHLRVSSLEEGTEGGPVPASPELVQVDKHGVMHRLYPGAFSWREAAKKEQADTRERLTRSALALAVGVPRQELRRRRHEGLKVLGQNATWSCPSAWILPDPGGLIPPLFGKYRAAQLAYFNEHARRVEELCRLITTSTTLGAVAKVWPGVWGAPGCAEYQPLTPDQKKRLAQRLAVKRKEIV